MTTGIQSLKHSYEYINSLVISNKHTFWFTQSHTYRYIDIDTLKHSYKLTLTYIRIQSNHSFTHSHTYIHSYRHTLLHTHLDTYALTQNETFIHTNFTHWRISRHTPENIHTRTHCLQVYITHYSFTQNNYILIWTHSNTYSYTHSLPQKYTTYLDTSWTCQIRSNTRSLTCHVTYRSLKHQDMYIYITHSDDTVV